VKLTPMMMQAARRRRRFLSTLLILGLGMPLLAAAPGPAPRPSPPARGSDEVKETLQVLMIVSMKKALDLTRDQEMQVVPKVQQILEERDRFAREHQDALRQMQIRLLEEAIPPQEFRRVVVHLDQMEREYREREFRLRSEIDRSLSPRQQAELRIFVPRFRRQMQVQIDEARRLQERRFRLQAPSASPLPDEDDSLDDDEF